MTKLYRRFTPLTLLILSINGMVGSAWLFAPLYAAKTAGPGALYAWLIAGIGTGVIALTFAELSVMFPVAGGTAHIPQRSHGTFASFVLSWLAWLAALTMAPVEVLAILQYASIYFPSLTDVSTGSPILTPLGYAWATLIMLTLCVINMLSFQGLVRFNTLIFTIKVGIILAAIIALLSTQFNAQNFSGISTYVHHSEGWQAILTAVATAGVAFAFTGFKHGVELAGETKRAALAIPLGVVGSVLAGLILYLGLQIAFIGALSPTALAQGWHMLSYTGDVGPFAGLAAGVGLFWLVKLLYLDATLSPAGAALIYVTSTARILYAMSDIGYMPKLLTQVNKHHFPVMAILVNFCLGLLLFLPLPGWQAMVSFLVSGMVISYAMGPIALLCLRKSLPNYPRRFRLPFARIICPCAFYFCNLLSYWTGWDAISKLGVAMAIGVIFFALAAHKGQIKRESTLGLQSMWWLVPYFAGLMIISYLGAFGGLHVIPFGWDFLVIAVFSLGILAIALKTRLSTAAILLDKDNHAQWEGSSEFMPALEHDKR